MEKTGTTERTFLPNHKPESHVRCHLSESATLTTTFISNCTSFVSFSGWLRIFLACYWLY
uniref:Uncharacterized protein n=1 Tax=Mesocestoides corti TaxID=53468 RepID=A0A5K3G1R5_MESCO